MQQIDNNNRYYIFNKNDDKYQNIEKYNQQKINNLIKNKMINQSDEPSSSNDLNWNNLRDIYSKNVSVNYNYYRDDYNEKRISNVVNEFVKLNDYLTSECKLFEELENALYFSSANKIVDFINNDLKVCIFIFIFI